MVNLDLFINKAHHVSFSAKQPIPVNDSNRRLYIVISGSVGVFEKVSNFRINCFKPGEVFGGYNFFTGKNDLLYIAEEDSVLFNIPANTFKEFATINPNIILELLRDAYSPSEYVLPKDVGTTFSVPMDTPGHDSLNQTQPVKTTAAIASLFPAGHKSYPNAEHPEYEKYTYIKEVKCPFCGEKIKVKRILESKLVSDGPMRYDLRHKYIDFQREWFNVSVCPKCYFAALTDYFVEPVSYSKTRAKEIVPELKDLVSINFEAPVNLDFVFISHYLALKCASVFHGKQNRIDMRLWADLSWLYEDAHDKDMELFSADKTSNICQDIFLSEQLSKEQQQVLSLQIAGMMYRSGNKNNITRWLFEAKNNKTGKKSYADIAEDLWEIIREERHEEKDN